MASRKKRSPSKKTSKKHNKSTKRQFLAALPQAFPTAEFPSFAMPAAPFLGAPLPPFPSFFQAQPQQQMNFKSSALPAFPTRMAPTGLSAMKMSTLRTNRMPMRSPFSGFPSTQNNPFVKVPQFPNANFYSGAPISPLSPGSPMRESMSGTSLSVFKGTPSTTSVLCEPLLLLFLMLHEHISQITSKMRYLNQLKKQFVNSW